MRFIVAALGVAIVSLGIAITLSSGILIRRFDAIESDLAGEKAAQALRALEADLNQLALSTRDYAQWDDAYDFVASRDAEFVKTSFSFVTLEGLQVDVMAFVDADGTITHAGEVDEVAHLVGPTLSPALLSAIRELQPQAAAASLRASSERILHIDGRLFAFSIVEISRSNLTDPTGVQLFFGRFIDKDEIERLQRTSRLPVELAVIGGNRITPVLQAWAKHRGNGGTLLPDSGHITAYRLIRDWSGAPLALISVSGEREIGQLGRRTTTALMSIISIMVLAFMGILLAMLQRMRKYWTEQLAQTQQHQRILACLQETIVLADPIDGRIVEVNDALLQSLGYTRDQLPQLTLEQLYVDMPAITLSVDTPAGFALRECHMRTSDGNLIETEVSATKVGAQDQELICIVARDITHRHQVERNRRDNEQRLNHLASHDALTGLPNRQYLQTTLPGLLREVAAGKDSLALIYIDLDHFKNVNDSRGHAFGERVLKIIAVRLRNEIATEDVVLRMGGDEFVVVGRLTGPVNDALIIGERLLSVVRAPVVIEDVTSELTASIGIAIYPMDGIDSESLLKHADIALYQAKEAGRDCCRMYTSDMNAQLSEQVAIEQALRRAIDTDQIVVEYQPVVDLHSGLLTSFEALARWNHPDWGSVSPGRFIPVAEKSNLIVSLGEQIVRIVLLQLADWQRAGLTPVAIAINVSAVQLERTEFASYVGRSAIDHDVDPRLLAFEVTESAWMQNSSRNTMMIEALRKAGSRIYIDDFGTGFSNLSYLKTLPVDALKIDQSFVRHIATDSSDVAIVGGIVTMARQMLLDTVAEGIETAQQAERLKQLGCKFGQGYYFSRPMQSAGCRSWLEQLAASRTHTTTLKMRAVRRG